MLSVPQRVNAIDSGNSPPLSTWSFSKSFLTTPSDTSTAAAVGMEEGSKACMLRPVGRTSGLRIGSPPGAGIKNSPFNNSMIPPSSLSATTCFKTNSRYAIRGVRRSSCTSGNPALMIAWVHGFFCPSIPPKKLPSSSNPFLTSLTRPLESVDWLTRARTAARAASVIWSLSSTSLSTPSLFPRYTSLISRPMEEAITRGRLSISSSGRSSCAMLTRVAMASSAEGGTPTV
mmetsp:Transcript_24794/g.37899  ORF Transcript_24794/g.37899 Transcript_24794/m.37899 type:complete len:231 (+) Transcript_24794:1139-1831(+)